MTALIVERILTALFALAFIALCIAVTIAPFIRDGF